MDSHNSFGAARLTARLRALAASSVVACALLCAASPVEAAVPQAERDALINLYNATQGSLWTNHAGWNGAAGTECYWSGVTCDASQSTVVGLNLNENNLHGTLTALTPFTNLAQFDVSQNSLTGPIPALTGLSNLQVFKAYSNQLSGSFPSLSGLTALQEFRVWSNQLSGPIPSLSDVTNLMYFDAQANQLTGPIPPITQLSALRELIVSNNQFTGSMPVVTGLTNLTKLDVSFNQLTGAIADLSTDTALQTLYIDHNNLSGALPTPPASLAIATVCPNALLTQTPNTTWDAITATSPWYENCGGPAKLVVTDINGGVTPVVGAKFTVTISAQDSNGAPALLNTYTYVQVSLGQGSGQLYSQSTLSARFRQGAAPAPCPMCRTRSPRTRCNWWLVPTTTTRVPC